jgi:hypothetical protein
MGRVIFTDVKVFAIFGPLEALGVLDHRDFTLIDYDATDPASSYRIVRESAPE